MTYIAFNQNLNTEINIKLSCIDQNLNYSNLPNRLVLLLIALFLTPAKGLDFFCTVPFIYMLYNYITYFNTFLFVCKYIE